MIGRRIIVATIMLSANLLSSMGQEAAYPEYDGRPWVERSSLPYSIPLGLEGRHIALWASHGRYYDSKTTNSWRWQRPNLFTTNEDLFTQAIVVPFLIPMLENAGAIVFTPRERDWQRNEVVVDNDGSPRGSLYVEADGKSRWEPTHQPGFALQKTNLKDEENLFMTGTARKAKTTSKEKRQSLVSYQPYIPAEGRYAVYVSYQTLENSIDDAHYTVWHKGQPTTFIVNQQMGGGTWVYLGTFNFDEGCSEDGRVELSNLSANRKGVVTTDAVRFGGGMGSIERGGETSGMPRAIEGSRYYAHWAGMPYSVYSTRRGTDDYADDINTRSLMTNYLGGGSPFMPDSMGLGVPIELTVAVHSDAGHSKDGSIVGSLGVCTTDHNDGLLASGLSRGFSRLLADTLVAGLYEDMTSLYGSWNRRGLWDRNYSETRLPNVPSAIVETLSHQNFQDMKLGLDPNVQFHIARSIYKSILRFLTQLSGDNYQVEPLAPECLSVVLDPKGKATLSWQPRTDALEPSSRAEAYVVYVSRGSVDFDEGTVINSTSCQLKLLPGVVHHFKVAALNGGGKSMDSEVVSACFRGADTKTVMVVNGFHRLAGPHVVETADSLGFDTNIDAGVHYMLSASMAGAQLNFNPERAGKVGPGALGYCLDDKAGMFVAGNTFDFIREHANAIYAAGSYNIVSCSSEAIERGLVSLDEVQAVDLLLGLEKPEGVYASRYKVFPPNLIQALRNFTSRGGGLLVSGSYVASGLEDYEEKAFLNDVLGCSLSGCHTTSHTSDPGRGSSPEEPASSHLRGMGTTLEMQCSSTASHYGSPRSDILGARGSAFPTIVYEDGGAACVAYDGGRYKALIMGFPFECIKTPKKQADIMKGFLNFLLNK